MKASEFKVYVGTYAKYNNGSIAGEWFDLEDYSDYAEFLKAATKLHKDESDPELMYQDRETPKGLEDLISESSIDKNVWPIMELDEDDMQKVAALIDDGFDTEDALEKYEEVCIIPCDYEHEAKDAYFDYWCEINSEMIEPLENAGKLSYLDEQHIYNESRHDGWSFVSGLGLVNTQDC